MADLSTLPAELPGDTPAKLARLSERTGRGTGAIVGEAVAAYVEHELAIVEAIEEGLTASRAGRVVPHDDVMRKARGIIEAARAGR